MTFLHDIFGRNGESSPFNPFLLSQVAARDPWSLDFPLFQWSLNSWFTLRNAFESVAIFGELGAAKTTGSGAWLLLKYLEIGMGGLFCCVKPGDRELIESFARMVGCEDRLMVISPRGKWRCNLIKYALKRRGIEGSRVEALVTLLMTIVEAAERGERGNGNTGDKFWQRALRTLLRNSIEICIASRQEISMQMIHDVIMSAPLSHAEVMDATWQKNSKCYQLIEVADHADNSSRQQRDFAHAAGYFLSEFPGMPNDTRGSILATYGVMADVLLRGHMADLFDGETNFVPEVTFEGAIIVLDLPTKIYGQAGLLVQSAFTYLWQTAAEQRDVKANPRPIFWFIDEAHELVANYTPDFLATARSARVATILISQNKPNYLAAMGGEAGRHRVDAFLGNMGTKIFHSNGDPETNRWASDMISDEIQTRMNFHGRRESTQGGGGGSESVGKKVLPSAFTTLKKGGEQNGFITEAIVYQTGAAFGTNGEPWMKTAFKQQIPGVTCRAKPE